VEVLPSGRVGISSGDAVSIVVDADEEKSIHYQPTVDDATSSGAAGAMLYKLAVLESGAAPEDKPTLKKWIAGSHIDYYQELPAVKTTLAAGDDIGVIIQKWDAADRCYKIRAIDTSAGELTAETASDAVSIRGNEVDGSLTFNYEDGVTSSESIEWKDGLVTTEGEIVITIPEGGEGGDTLPDGVYTGDLLYWDATLEPPAWVVLTAPTTPATGEKIFVTHPGRGTAPEFLTLKEISTFICVAGTPTEYKIYGEEVE
jgi:hypothetical protein